MNNKYLWWFVAFFCTFVIISNLYVFRYVTHTRESFVTEEQDTVTKIYKDLNDNVNKFNDKVDDANKTISNNIFNINDNINNVSQKTISDIRNLNSKLLEYESEISKIKQNYANKDILAKYASMNVLNDTVMQNNKFNSEYLASKMYVESEFTPYKKFKDLEQSINITDSTNKNEFENVKSSINTITTTYLPLNTADTKYASFDDMKVVKRFQDDIPNNYVKKADADNTQTNNDIKINKVDNNINDFKTFVNTNYTNTKNLKDKLEQDYTPLHLHNRVSDTVNNTLISLNTAIMRTIENDSDTAIATKLSMIDNNYDSIKDELLKIQSNTKNIGEDVIERDELILGKFRLSGIDPGNNIRIYDRDRNNISGGFVVNEIQTNTFTSKVKTNMEGEIQLGSAAINKPILINGFADISIDKGKVELKDTNATHRVMGSVEVSNLKADNIQIGSNKVDSNLIDNVVSKLQDIENRVSNIENKKRLL